jgi:radical SAM protein with 4Fe4S-binding SPASM domain
MNNPPRGIESFPGQRHLAIGYIGVETAAHCNRACHFCPTNNTVFPPKAFMERELFERIIADLASWGYRGGFSLYGHNEALLDRRLVELTRYAQEQLLEIHQSLSTNGDKLTLETALALFDAGLKTMLVNCYDDRNNLIERMLAIAKHLESLPGYHVHYVGSDARAFPMHYHPTDRSFTLYDARKYGEGFPGISSRAGNVAGFLTLAEPLAQNCERPWTHVHVKYNGDVILCCQDWAEEVVLGNMREQSLVDIYNGQLAEHYRTKLGERDRRGLKLCERCDWGND